MINGSIEFQLKIRVTFGGQGSFSSAAKWLHRYQSPGAVGGE